MTKKNREKLILELFRKKCIDFGAFKLKSGVMSPYYIDLRKLVSYPRLLKDVAAAYWTIIKKLKFQRLAGVPYAALPIAAVISSEFLVPWLYTRKETQDYGITKMVQGEYKKGDVVVLIDDIITTGASKLMVIEPLEKSGLRVKDVVLLIDRENGGKEILEKEGYKLHTVFLMTEILDILVKRGMVSEGLDKECRLFMEKTKRDNLKKIR